MAAVLDAASSCIGFLPVLVAGGWVLLARQPADWMNTSNWSRDLGIFGSVADVGNDPAGDRLRDRARVRALVRHRRPRREVVPEEPVRETAVPVTETRDTRAADEPLTADRGPYAEPPTVPVVGLSDGDDREPTVTTTGDRRTET